MKKIILTVIISLSSTAFASENMTSQKHFDNSAYVYFWFAVVGLGLQTEYCKKGDIICPYMSGGLDTSIVYGSSHMALGVKAQGPWGMNTYVGTGYANCGKNCRVREGSMIESKLTRTYENSKLDVLFVGGGWFLNPVAGTPNDNQLVNAYIQLPGVIFKF